VVTPVTGHEEYVVHGWNGLVADWDDLRGTARQLDLLARDRRLLHFLRTNALATARTWPSWEQSGQFMAAALRAIHRELPPPAGAGAAQLLADLRAGLETHRGHLAERRELDWKLKRVQRVVNNPVVRALRRVRASRPFRVLVRPARPLYRRLRGRR
jgi:hypothetical protein